MTDGRVRSSGRLLLAAAVWAVLAACSSATLARAQVAPATASPAHERGDIAGDWQGTAMLGKPTRVVLRVAKAEKGWSGKIFLIGEQGSQSFNVTGLALDGSTFKFKVDLIGGSYEGTLSADGTTSAGNLSGAGPNPIPLTFVRATKETAWEIPAPPPPAKLMAADADPSFDVATIKPNNSGASQMQGLTMNGRNFATRNSSLGDLIAFAYNVQAKQIVSGPDWMDKDRYDIAAVPDKDGTPNPEQLRIMMRKLLADRFKLTFHHEKRDLSAFVLSIGKNGQKLNPTQMSGPLPGLGMRPGANGLTLMVRNATLGDFTSFMQMLVLDRPVVDQTALSGRFDFQLTFTPDDSQFNGHPPKPPSGTETTEPAPDLFTAIQQQVGLRLEAEKTAVDVIVVDHVEKPSAN